MNRLKVHEESFDLDDLVQTDLTGLGEAVESYVEEYAKAHKIGDSVIEYGWSCNVVVKIYRKEFGTDAEVHDP